jgi:uncharacterized protein DUF4062
MRIFVSSSFEDLRDHRVAAVRVLRQLGHEVVAMEEMVAGAAALLPKVVEMVDRGEAYVGILAWRYGYVPVPNAATEGQPAPAIPELSARSTVKRMHSVSTADRYEPRRIKSVCGSGPLWWDLLYGSR